LPPPFHLRLSVFPSGPHRFLCPAFSLGRLFFVLFFWRQLLFRGDFLCFVLVRAEPSVYADHPVEAFAVITSDGKKKFSVFFSSENSERIGRVSTARSGKFRRQLKSAKTIFENGGRSKFEAVIRCVCCALCSPLHSTPSKKRKT
jgi:hypothetical protein